MIFLYVVIGIATYIGVVALSNWAIRKDVDKELEEQWGSSYTQYKNRK